jgi:hypothetical protein
MKIFINLGLSLFLFMSCSNSLILNGTYLLNGKAVNIDSTWAKKIILKKNHINFLLNDSIILNGEISLNKNGKVNFIYIPRDIKDYHYEGVYSGRVQRRNQNNKWTNTMKIQEMRNDKDVDIFYGFEYFLRTKNLEFHFDKDSSIQICDSGCTHYFKLVRIN